MGTGVIVLPRRVAEFAGADGWIIVLGLTLLAMGLGWLISAAMTAVARAGGSGFVAGVGAFLGRPLAYVFAVLLWIKIVFSAGLELRVFLGITREVLLPRTPVLVVGAVMVLLCAYAAAKGLETRARVGELLLAVMVLPVAFLVGLAFFNGDFSNLQPMFVASPNNLVSGIFGLGFMFTGMEMLLLVLPFLSGGKGMGRAVVTSLGFAGAFITLITIITIAEFGPSVVNQAWPVLRLMDMLNLPGSFIERQEALMFSFWIITTFTLVSGMLFFGSVLVQETLRPKGLSKGVLLTGAAVFGVAAIPWEGDAIYKRLDFMYITFGLFFLVLLPGFLLAAAKIRSRTKAVKSLSILFILAIISLSFTSCWDKVEIEDRAFVIAMGIDKADGGYMISLSMPVAENNQDEENHIKTATARTITEAMKKLDARSDKDLYYGQVKLIVLGNDLLQDQLLLEGTINAINSHQEIDRRINVVAAEDSALDILKTKPPGETLPGLYTAELYRKKDKVGGASFALDFERFSTALTFSDGAIIPMLRIGDTENNPPSQKRKGSRSMTPSKQDNASSETPTDEASPQPKDDKTLKLEGAAVIKNHQKIGELTHNELIGFLWAFSNGNKSAVVTIELGGNPTPVTVEKHSTKTSFHQAENKLIATINIKITGKVEESAFSEYTQPSKPVMEEIRQSLASQISSEIATTANKLQNELALDGYDWLETIRKKHHDLYLKHAPHWPQRFATIEVIPHVTVNVRA